MKAKSSHANGIIAAVPHGRRKTLEKSAQRSPRVSKALFGLLFALLAVAGMLFMVTPLAEAAEVPEGKTELTEQMAREFAEEFADSVNGKEPVYVADVVKFYDENGQAVGFSIDYLTSDKENAGYVVFDSECPGLIAEYSFEPGSVSPLSKLADVQTLSRNSAEMKPLRTSPFVYALEDVNSHTLVDMYGNVEEMPTEALPTSTPITPSWETIFFDYQGNLGYNIVKTNHFTDFMSFDESWIESETGRYACAVSALMNLAAANDLAYTFNWDNIAAEYNALWNATNTRVISVSNGISYGSTYDSDLGPGYVSYCAARGKSLTYSLKDSPSYNQYVTSIDNGRSSVFMARIVASSGDVEGHSMAVQGYATLQKQNTVSDFLYSLIVSDGWSGYARYLNFYYANYYNTAGVFFS